MISKTNVCINCDVTDYVVMFLTVIFQIQNM